MCTRGFILKKSICKFALFRPALFRPDPRKTNIQSYNDDILGIVYDYNANNSSLMKYYLKIRG